MGILSGSTALAKNALFPAAYVLIGHLSDLEKYVGTLSLDNIKAFKINTDKAAWRDSISSILSQAWANCTVANAKSVGNQVVEIGSSIGESAYHLTPKGSVVTASTALSQHYIDVATAATIGGTATIINAFLKRVAFLRNHPYLRVATSVSLAAAVTYGAAQALSVPITPQRLTDIAVKVGVVGALSKVALSASKLAIRGISSGAIYLIDFLNYGSLPESEVKRRTKAKKD